MVAPHALRSLTPASLEHMERLLRQCQDDARREGLGFGFALQSELGRSAVSCQEARLAEQMPAPRRREFLLGRLAARRAFLTLALPPVPIGAQSRIPVFPAEIVGSISHSCGVGVALLAKASDLAAVGVDIEVRRIPAAAARHICTADELQWVLAPASERRRAERAAALLSAKESIYKAAPRRVQASVRWRDIAVAPGTHEFSAAGHAPAGPHSVMAGRWHIGRVVVTWVTRPSQNVSLTRS
jgi:enterobactin synthetase component D